MYNRLKSNVARKGGTTLRRTDRHCKIKQFIQMHEVLSPSHLFPFTITHEHFKHFVKSIERMRN